MATTAVALFDDRHAAGVAVDALLAAKFTAADIDTVSEAGSDWEGDLADAVRHGNTLVAVRMLGASGERAKSILKAAGATQVGEYTFSGKQHGWEGFEVAPAAVEQEIIAATRDLYEEAHEEAD